MRDLTKTQRRLLREALKRLHAEELGRDLESLARQFDDWRAGRLDAFHLSDFIQDFHEGTAAHLWEKYEPHSNSHLVVAEAIASGRLDRSTVPAVLLEGLAAAIALYERMEREAAARARKPKAVPDPPQRDAAPLVPATAGAVALASIVDALECDSEGLEQFLDRETGDIIVLSDDDELEEEEEDATEVGDVDPAIPSARAVRENPERYLELPAGYEIKEYDMLRRFCDSIDDDGLRRDLQYAIQGKGAFRRVKDRLARAGRLDD